MLMKNKSGSNPQVPVTSAIPTQSAPAPPPPTTFPPIVEAEIPLSVESSKRAPAALASSAKNNKIHPATIVSSSKVAKIETKQETFATYPPITAKLISSLSPSSTMSSPQSLVTQVSQPISSPNSPGNDKFSKYKKRLFKQKSITNVNNNNNRLSPTATSAVAASGKNSVSIVVSGAAPVTGSNIPATPTEPSRPLITSQPPLQGTTNRTEVKTHPISNFVAWVFCCFASKSRSTSTTKSESQQQRPPIIIGTASSSAGQNLAISGQKSSANSSPAGTVNKLPAGNNGRYLLKPLAPEDRGKKCLVLDLDETLVHSSFKPVPNSDYIVPVEIDNVIHNVYVLKRPFVDEFLLKMGELYEVVIFTASLSKYADPVIDNLDKHRVVKHRLFRESCFNHRGSYVKDLSQLGRDLAGVIILDNSPTSYLFHPGNAVPCTSWFNDTNDVELMDLIGFFVDLSTVENVVSVLDNAEDDDDDAED